MTQPKRQPARSSKPAYAPEIDPSNPAESDHAAFEATAQADSFTKLSALASQHRALGREVVVVQGLGFVGAAVAAAVASARNSGEDPRYFVIGIDLPTPAGLAKIAAITAGATPILASDQNLAIATRNAVLKEKNLHATWDNRALGLADIVIVDVPLDAKLDAPGPKWDARNQGGPAPAGDDIRVGIEAFETAIRSIGSEMRADALVIVETTVPVGVCERIVRPILNAERSRRAIAQPLRLAHAYERVTPGPNYLDSIRRCHRVYSGIDDESRSRTRAFLSSVVDADSFPLYELADTESSELAKLLENSYRAVNIAMLQEWTLLAEKIGIDLFAVIDAIRRRRGTHDNIRLPGFGVGGYCLTKDSLLAQWSADRFFGGTVGLDLTLQALAINRDMPLHTFDLVQELADPCKVGAKIAVLGASYLPDVADARNSPTATLADALIGAGARVSVHDPVLGHWAERPDISLSDDLASVLAGADGVVLAVAHLGYGKLTVQQWIDATPGGAFFVDANNILNDHQAGGLHRTGRRVLGVGKGHWRRQGLHLRNREQPAGGEG